MQYHCKILSQQAFMHVGFLNLQATLPKLLSDMVLSTFTVQGAVPVTQNNIQDMLGQFSESIFARLAASAPPTATPAAAAAAANAATAIQTPFQLWSWANARKKCDQPSFHMCPQHWKFPKDLNVKLIWGVWWHISRRKSVQWRILKRRK